MNKQSYSNTQHDEKQLQESLAIMIDSINQILKVANPSVMLYGSITQDDFRFGWSDIDFLCITDVNVTTEQADELLELRQRLAVKYNNPYLRLFEGVITSKNTLENSSQGNSVYWGTSGQRIKKEFKLDTFAKIELIENGMLLFGEDFRNLISYPSRDEIIFAVKNHYDAIIKYGSQTDESLYSAGWMLDIARCIYTLRHLKTVSKTRAGEWALKNSFCPNPNVMRKVIRIRKNPQCYKHEAKTLVWLKKLNIYIVQFAKILEAELAR